MISIPRIARKMAGYNAETVAKELGIAPSHVYDVERGMKTLDSDSAKKMAELYGRDIDELFAPRRYAVKFPEKSKKTITSA